MSAAIDLHMHSIFSDGTDTLEELLNSVLARGIRTFSLTDHDTVDGVRRMASLVPQDVRFIPGVEFSCRTEHGKCHILGYNYDLDSPALSRVLQHGSELRTERLASRLNTLARDHGIAISENDREYLYSLNCAGKPHLAALLVRLGYTETITDAIQTYLRNERKASDRIDAHEAVHGILDSRGIPVWAHPLGGCNEKKLTESEFQSQLKTLLSCGLRGMECYYSLYKKDEIEFLTGTAKQHGLYISGGSDYHGRAKSVSLGCLSTEQTEILHDAITILQAI